MSDSKQENPSFETRFKRGNEMWKRRAKSGRDAIFKTPQQLWDSCIEYFKMMDAREDWNGQDWVGKDGLEVELQKRIPYTITGLCMFLGVSSKYFNDFKKSQTYLSDPEFTEVYTRIEDIIKTQQIEGAMLGYYNPSLTARLNGITEKTDITSGGEAITAPTIIVQSKQGASDLENL